MSFVDDLRAARGSAATAYHTFLLDYKSNGRSIYCFFEGQDDPSFYLNFISAQKPTDWHVCIYRCNNKLAVYESYKKISTQQTKPGECLFFVDKDLSNYIGDAFPNSQQIFVTEYYSIENYLASPEMLKRIWIEIFHLSVPSREFDDVVHKFKQAQKGLHRLLLVIMAWAVYLKRVGCPTNLNGLDLSGMYAIGSDLKITRRVAVIYVQRYLEKTCQTKTPNGSAKHIRTIAKLLQKQNPKTYIRGKFELWFLIQFVKVLEGNYREAAYRENIPFNVRTTLSLKNAIEILGPRLTIPSTLQAFLENNMERLKLSTQQLQLPGVEEAGV